MCSTLFIILMYISFSNHTYTQTQPTRPAMRCGSACVLSILLLSVGCVSSVQSISLPKHWVHYILSMAGNFCEGKPSFLPSSSAFPKPNDSFSKLSRDFSFTCTTLPTTSHHMESFQTISIVFWPCMCTNDLSYIQPPLT